MITIGRCAGATTATGTATNATNAGGTITTDGSRIAVPMDTMVIADTTTVKKEEGRGGCADYGSIRRTVGLLVFP